MNLKNDAIEIRNLVSRPLLSVSTKIVFSRELIGIFGAFAELLMRLALHFPFVTTGLFSVRDLFGDFQVNLLDLVAGERKLVPPRPIALGKNLSTLPLTVCGRHEGGKIGFVDFPDLLRTLSAEFGENKLQLLQLEKYVTVF